MATAPPLPSRTVGIGLHGLGELLRHIRSDGLQRQFEGEMKTSDLVVHLNEDTAKKIKDFVQDNFDKNHPIMVKMNDDGCDPATDPWCINT
jgi:hypothetical protein